MPFTVIYDACVLHPAPLRDLLIRVGMTGAVRARWTERILDECFASILKRRTDLDAKVLARTRQLMMRAIPDCLVKDYESLIDAVVLPDANDRHVLAAAIHTGAQSIVTLNLKDFPALALSKYGIEAVHPDDFVLGVLDLAPGTACAAVAQQAKDLANPPTTLDALFDVLRDQGLVRSVAQFKVLMS